MAIDDGKPMIVGGIEVGWADAKPGIARENTLLTTGPGMALDVYVTSTGDLSQAGGIVRVYAKAGASSRRIPRAQVTFKRGENGKILSVRGNASAYEITFAEGTVLEGADSAARPRISYGLSRCGAPEAEPDETGRNLFEERSTWASSIGSGTLVLSANPCLVRQVYGTVMQDGEAWYQLWDDDNPGFPVLLDVVKVWGEGDTFEFQYVPNDGAHAGRFANSLAIKTSSTKTSYTYVASDYYVTSEVRKGHEVTA